MSYRNQELPEIPGQPSTNEEMRWYFVRGISKLSKHRGDNAGLCIHVGMILQLIDMMGLHTRCQRLLVYSFPEYDIKSVFKVTDQTYGDTCTIINNACRSNDE